MNRRRFVVSAISSAAVVGCSGSSVGSKFLGGGSGGPGGSPAAQYTLTAQYATRTISGRRIRTRTYDGMPFGPTLTVIPGQPLTVNLVNKLPPNPPENPPKPINGALIPDVDTSMQAMRMPANVRMRPSRRRLSVDNNPHGFNTTNLHVHGIQTIPHLFQPLGTGDPAAMMIEVEPGTNYFYSFPIPEDHPSGLHWYHPHKHGSTDVQVSGGMAGLIVVRGPIDEVPEIKAAREFFVVVQSLNVNKSPTEDLYEREYVAYKTKKEGGYSYGTQFTMLTVNGEGVNWIDNSGDDPVLEQLTVPQYDVRPGEVVRVRLLNGTNGIPLALALPGFTSWQIGFDGVNLVAPKLKDISGAGTPLVNEKNLFTAPYRLAMEGNRIELLIQAPASPGSYKLSSLPTKGISDSMYGNIDLVEFVVSGEPVKMGIPASLPRPEREYPLVTDADLVDSPKRFRFSQGKNDQLLMGFGFTVNDRLYEMLECPTTVKRGTCEEWIIENDTEEAHPFHIHMISFQVEEVAGIKKDSEIWDTFIIPPKIGETLGELRIRMRFKQFHGKEVFHCHILPHEDTGMMQNFLVLP
jgi:suppressor of ftsI